jgi:hypothetical protein
VEFFSERKTQKIENWGPSTFDPITSHPLGIGIHSISTNCSQHNALSNGIIILEIFETSLNILATKVGKRFKSHIGDYVRERVKTIESKLTGLNNTAVYVDLHSSKISLFFKSMKFSKISQKSCHSKNWYSIRKYGESMVLHWYLAIAYLTGPVKDDIQNAKNTTQ